MKSTFVILPLSKENWSSLCSLTDLKAPSCTASRRVCWSARHESLAESIKIEIHYWNLQSKRLGLYASRMGRSFSSPIFRFFSLLFRIDLRNMYFEFPVVGIIPFWNKLCYNLSPGTLYILSSLILWQKISGPLEKAEIHWIAKWWHRGFRSRSVWLRIFCFLQDTIKTSKAGQLCWIRGAGLTGHRMCAIWIQDGCCMFSYVLACYQEPWGIAHGWDTCNTAIHCMGWPLSSPNEPKLNKVMMQWALWDNYVF